MALAVTGGQTEKLRVSGRLVTTAHLTNMLTPMHTSHFFMKRAPAHCTSYCPHGSCSFEYGNGSMKLPSMGGDRCPHSTAQQTNKDNSEATSAAFHSWKGGVPGFDAVIVISTQRESL